MVSRSDHLPTSFSRTVLQRKEQMVNLKESEVDSFLAIVATEKSDQPRNAGIHCDVSVQRSREAAERV